MIKASRKFKSPHYDFSVNTKGSWVILREIKEMDFQQFENETSKMELRQEYYSNSFSYFENIIQY